MSLRDSLCLGVTLLLAACMSKGGLPAPFDPSQPDLSVLDLSSPFEPEDLRQPQPDLRRPGSCVDYAGIKAVGESCTNATKCDCSGPKPTCLASFEFGETIDLPSGYCSNAGCILNQDDTCGDNGVCADPGGTADAVCFQRCLRGRCRTDYACITVLVDGSSMTSRTTSVCLPRNPIVECDPTAAPTTQCTSVGGVVISTVTNGNPNAACMRIGPDPVGQCLYLPCQIGPRNCPALSGTPYGCFYFDVQRNTASPDPADTFKGTVCLPVPGVQKRDGDACSGGFNTCGDNFYCDGAVCRQLCYNGAQPTYAGGRAIYKNAALACPAGRTCQNAFGLAGTSWTGLCRP